MTGKELIKKYKSCLKGFEDVGSTDILEEMIDTALIEARTEPVAKLQCSDGLDMRKAITDDAILLIKASLSDCHLPDLISCLQTTRASLKLKADKLIELRKQG